jgi:hypothetical protein
VYESFKQELIATVDRQLQSGMDADDIKSIVEQAIEDNDGSTVDLNQIAVDETQKVAQESGLSGKD